MQKNHEYLFWSIAILNKNHGMELFFFLKKMCISDLICCEFPAVTVIWKIQFKISAPL